MVVSRDFSGRIDMRIIKAWLIPFLISIGLFLTIRPVLAQTISVPNNINVGTQTVDGFMQIFYEEAGNRKFITSGNVNSHSPVVSGTFIVYVADINGAGQIFLYDVTTGSKTQLTFSQMNLNPKVDDKGRVVWEGWDINKWQIFFFDGKSVKKLTSGDLSLNPDFGGEYISYARRDTTGTWRTVIYSIKDDKSVDVAVGEEARTPKIKDGDIYLAFGSLIERKFPLSVTDLFLLNLMPLTATGSATPASASADTLNELNASPSAVVEIPLASESGNLTPESTSSGQPDLSPTPAI